MKGGNMHEVILEGLMSNDMVYGVAKFWIYMYK
jgi:hypothetical protein